MTYLTLYAVNQAQVQRLLTVRDLKSAQIAVWINWPILSILSLSTSMSGLVIYYYYRTCDPLEQGRITSRDQNMARYVMDGEKLRKSLKIILSNFSLQLWVICLESAACSSPEYSREVYRACRRL